MKKLLGTLLLVTGALTVTSSVGYYCKSKLALEASRDFHEANGDQGYWKSIGHRRFEAIIATTLVLTAMGSSAAFIGFKIRASHQKRNKA